MISLFEWLKTRFTSRSGEGDTQLAIDESGVVCRRPSGTVESIARGDLQTVTIKTIDGGPFAADVLYVLSGAKGGCIVPQSVPESGELLERLQKLLDFDNNAVISAIECTENDEFLCWNARCVETSTFRYAG